MARADAHERSTTAATATPTDMMLKRKRQI